MSLPVPVPVETLEVIQARIPFNVLAVPVAPLPAALPLISALSISLPISLRAFSTW